MTLACSRLSESGLSPPQRPLCVVGRLGRKKKRARAFYFFDYFILMGIPSGSLCEGERKVGKTRRKKIREKLALPSFLPFYFRVCAFSIQRTRLSAEPRTGYRDTSAWKLRTPSYGLLFTHNTRLRYPRENNGYLGLRVKCSRGKEDWKLRHARNAGEMRRRAYPLFSHAQHMGSPPGRIKVGR